MAHDRCVPGTVGTAPTTSASCAHFPGLVGPSSPATARPRSAHTVAHTVQTLPLSVICRSSLCATFAPLWRCHRAQILRNPFHVLSTRDPTCARIVWQKNKRKEMLHSTWHETAWRLFAGQNRQRSAALCWGVPALVCGCVDLCSLCSSLLTLNRVQRLKAAQRTRGAVNQRRMLGRLVVEGLRVKGGKYPPPTLEYLLRRPQPLFSNSKRFCSRQFLFPNRSLNCHQLVLQALIALACCFPLLQAQAWAGGQAGGPSWPTQQKEKVSHPEQMQRHATRVLSHATSLLSHPKPI